MAEDYHDDSGDTLSLRQKVFRAYERNPAITAKPIMKDLHLQGDKKLKLINNYLSKARHITTNLAYPKNPKLHKRTFVWENVPRALLFQKFPSLKDGFVRALGWELISNRNGMWIFRHDFGSVHWYQKGTVMLYLRGELQLAKAKELFCKAFQKFLSDEDLSRFVDVPLTETERHWLFETGQKLPRFDIRQFEPTHGLRFYSDGSDPTKFEVRETEPFWLNRLDGVADKFGLHFDRHENLVNTFAEESVARRRLYELEANRRQGNSLVSTGLFYRFCCWLSKERSF